MLGATGYAPWAVGVVAVACAEEALLRGSLYRAVEQRAGAVAAVAITACAFAIVHIPLYGWAVVPLDLAVGVWLGVLRAVSRFGDSRPRSPTRWPTWPAGGCGDRCRASPAGGASPACSLLTLGWLLAPHFAPPVYDGVGFPDEPYRFVVRAERRQDPQGADDGQERVPVTKGTAAAAALASAEQAPQVAILIPTGRLQAPPARSSSRCRPHRCSRSRTPSGTYLWSNVYAVGAD